MSCLSRRPLVPLLALFAVVPGAGSLEPVGATPEFAFLTSGRTPLGPADRCELPVLSAEALAATADPDPLPARGTIERIVCRFHVVRRSDGTGGVDEALIPKMMRDLNYGFRDTQFRFVREPGVTYFDNDEWYEDFPAPLDQVPLVNAGWAPGVLSWYITPLIGGGTAPAGAWVGPPYTSGMRGVVMAYGNTGTPRNIVTPTHEVGHLGVLHHPFETVFGTECVQRIGFNCQNTGDLLCDTPASPGLGSNMTATGIYIGGELGPCPGDPVYDPDGTLVMDSSGPWGHVTRNRFSPEQTARMTSFFFGLQQDLFGPDRPDFLVDCNGNGVDDMDEVVGGQVEDVNSDLVPDECQVFPAPGDLVVSGMTSSLLNRPRYYDGATGDYRGELWNGMSWAHQLRLGPDGYLYMPTSWVVQRLDLATGRTHDNLIDGVVEGAQVIVDLLFEPDGNILVLDNVTADIRRYDGVTSDYLGVFSTISANMTSPKYMEWGPDGNIYVVGNGAQGNSVRRVDGGSGAPLGAFVSPGDGGLGAGQGLTFHGGHLYVSDAAGNEVLRYDALTGDFDRVFVSSGDGMLGNPHSLRFGPDGHLYVASRGTNSVKRYDGSTGDYIDDFVAAGSGGNPGSGGLEQPAGLFFVPSNPVHVAEVPVPARLSAGPLRPNPTRGPTTLFYRLERRADVTAGVYDLLGRRVRALSPGERSPGEHSLTWDGRDSRGAPVASGVYFLRLAVDGESVNRRVQLVR